jgi:ubiquinol-cytochrome c reductase iron-sulfur subunit
MSFLGSHHVAAQSQSSCLRKGKGEWISEAGIGGGMAVAVAVKMQKWERIVASETSTEPTRRDFLYIATSGAAAVGVAAVVWPLVSQMNPDASTLALASTELDVAAIAEGQIVTIKWRGRPVFIRHRTADEIKTARAQDDDPMPDPATDASRVQKPQFLIVVGVCTHLGCIPLGHQGDYDGWFCPCHGSVYDLSARIRKGPAPKNLEVPQYSFLSDTKVKIG